MSKKNKELNNILKQYFYITSLKKYYNIVDAIVKDNVSITILNPKNKDKILKEIYDVNFYDFYNLAKTQNIKDLIYREREILKEKFNIVEFESKRFLRFLMFIEINESYNSKKIIKIKTNLIRNLKDIFTENFYLTFKCFDNNDISFCFFTAALYNKDNRKDFIDISKDYFLNIAKIIMDTYICYPLLELL